MRTLALFSSFTFVLYIPQVACPLIVKWTLLLEKGLGFRSIPKTIICNMVVSYIQYTDNMVLLLVKQISDLIGGFCKLNARVP